MFPVREVGIKTDINVAGVRIVLRRLIVIRRKIIIIIIKEE